MKLKKKKIKLNIGSGSRPLKSYINIDFDTISKLKKDIQIKNLVKI